ncbi:MAG: hypothetical protein A2X86_22415 [Bdellovibrionales bacterium GWA2_49_15]|nr:MAG: hypothetical protein A2X86_22415 [Bdellovibrionales bacterium GWA2_49_15]HAZ14217.1 hypothetical protein [Bdellovibrionales bacterium]
MAVKLIPSTNYINDRAKIMDDIIKYALKTNDNAIPILSFFRREERDLQRRIKTSPLSAGVDFPRPAKKGTTRTGQYVILYTYLPPDAPTNQDVTRVNLDSIMPTASGTFNKLVTNLEQAKLEE